MDRRKRPGGPPRTRERLLDGVARAVRQHGLRAVTMNQILEASSLARRTFYLHFASKEAAFTALYEAVVADLITSIRRSSPATPAPPGWTIGM